MLHTIFQYETLKIYCNYNNYVLLRPEYAQKEAKTY